MPLSIGKLWSRRSTSSGTNWRLRRRQQGDTRQHDSLLGPMLETVGVLLVCCLPLLVCWQLLARLANETQETTITQLLLMKCFAKADYLLSRVTHSRPGKN